MFIEKHKRLFTEDQLIKLPLTYHFMKALQTDKLKELNFGKRFSTSEKHQTNYYLNQMNYKPASSLTFDEMNKEKTEKTITHTQRIEVAFSDIDALHIVWHGKYVKYFEEAREGFGEKYGFGYMDFYDRGFITPLVDLRLSYKKIVEYNETIKVHVTYVPVEAAKIIFTYEIHNEKDEVVCTGKTIQVITTFNKKLILTAPSFIKEWKQKWLS